MSKTLSMNLQGFYKLALAAVILILGVLFFAFGTSAASGSLWLSPASKWVAPGQSFTVDVKVSSRTRINAVEGTVTYPKTLLTAASVSSDGTVVTLWAEQPRISAGEGTVRFAGGITGGLIGDGKVVSITFTANSAGYARVTVEDNSVLAHDGQGTPVGGTAGAGRFTLQAERPARTFLGPGDLIKLPDDGNPATQVDTAVYLYGDDGLRYVFPNSKTYFTWYNDFSGVKVVPLDQMQNIRLGGNVTYRPGVKMVKIDSDPKVYAVGRGGSLHWVKDEALAIALYGADWNRKIDDVADSFFSHYTRSSDISTIRDFVPAEQTAAASSIAADKDMEFPVEITMNADGSFTPAVVTVKSGRTVRFTNAGTGNQRVKAAAGSIEPGFDSAHVPPGLDYAYKFTRAGSIGFQNAADTSKSGTIVVQ